MTLDEVADQCQLSRRTIERPLAPQPDRAEGGGASTIGARRAE
jgi:hypothetical protein